MLALIYHLIGFTDLLPDGEVRNDIGFSYNTLSALNIAVHLFIILRRGYNNIRRFCLKRKHEKLVKQAQIKK